jgi:hypothetical protein
MSLAGQIIIKTTPADSQHAALQSDGIGLLMSPDKIELHFDSFAKKAAAFFNISRSISSRLFSPAVLDTKCQSHQLLLALDGLGAQRETLELGMPSRRAASWQE